MGIDVFSDACGIVDHNDVLRAVALILRNTATECRDADLFVDHLDQRLNETA